MSARLVSFSFVVFRGPTKQASNNFRSSCDWWKRLPQRRGWLRRLNVSLPKQFSEHCIPGGTESLKNPTCGDWIAMLVVSKCFDMKSRNSSCVVNFLFFSLAWVVP